jgi:mRNA interferase MazF
MTSSRRPAYHAGPSFDRGDVILVPFPFADRLAEKQRPAIVVSSNGYQGSGGDLIIAQLTSRTNAPPRLGDHILRQWQAAGLPLPSLARARVTTIHRSRVRKRLGRLLDDDLRAVDRGLRAAMQL